MKKIWEIAEMHSFAFTNKKIEIAFNDSSFKEFNERIVLNDSNIDNSIRRFLDEYIISKEKSEMFFIMKVLLKYEFENGRIEEAEDEVEIVENILKGDTSYTKKEEEKEFIKKISEMDEKSKICLLFDLNALIYEYE